jgi:threonine synthase
MRLEDFPKPLQPYLIPKPAGEMIYRCLGCGAEFGIQELLYTCPACGQVLLIHDIAFDRLKAVPGPVWHQIFDYRRMLRIPALKGIYRFHEFIGPVIPLEAVVYLGEGHTPLVEANPGLQAKAGICFYFKNDGQNPSASFKDRGMASALSYINYLITSGQLSEVLAVCASTGDTSAAAALYASYLRPKIKSAVLLPHKKVTPQQLSQPLGSGARVYEIPGVFDDCMKVVEALSEKYQVALLNSKNAWRILGQESYSYEIAQEFEYALADKVIVLPIGNAGNITAVLSGFIKFLQIGIIDRLPKIIGVQSHHADPVYQYYAQEKEAQRVFKPQTVRPSVAQAAMIGNPVSMPRVIQLVKTYNELAGSQRIFFVQVSEQHIMDWQLIANRNGHVACTHGGECLAGLHEAKQKGLIKNDEIAVLDSTAHALKFAGFQDLYFENALPTEFEIIPDRTLINRPVFMQPENLETVPAPGNPLHGAELERFVQATCEAIAADLALQQKENK